MKRRWVAVIAAVLAVWMGGYAFLTRSPDATAYRELCVQAAQDALDGLGTARLSAGPVGDPELVGTYTTSMLDDAQKLIGGARASLAGPVPPDVASARLRDKVTPLLDRAERGYQDLAMARAEGDTNAQYAAAQRMQPTEDQLRAFVERYR